MGIPAGTTRITLSGTLAGVEHWATSHFITGHVASEINDTYAAGRVGAASFTNLVASIRAMLAGDDTIDSLDAYFYDGGTAAVRHGHAAVGATGLGGTGGPKQTACVVTLRSALTSRSGRGRMYFPATGGVYSAGGKLTTASVNSLVDNVGLWFADSNSAGFPVVVVSQTHTSSSPVLTVDADYLPDTQRGRRGKLTSTRHSHAAV